MNFFGRRWMFPAAVVICSIQALHQTDKSTQESFDKLWRSKFISRMNTKTRCMLSLNTSQQIHVMYSNLLVNYVNFTLYAMLSKTQKPNKNQIISNQDFICDLIRNLLGCTTYESIYSNLYLELK